MRGQRLGRKKGFLFFFLFVSSSLLSRSSFVRTRCMIPYFHSSILRFNFFFSLPSFSFECGFSMFGTKMSSYDLLQFSIRLLSKCVFLYISRDFCKMIGFKVCSAYMSCQRN